MEDDRTIHGSQQALLLPGSGYTAMAPLLYWCSELVQQTGWSVRTVDWPGAEADDADPLAMVETTVERESADGLPGLIIAKSLGTFAAPWAAARGVPGVWLTPLATDPRVLAALRSMDSRSIVVAGLADRYWRPGAMEGAAPRTLEVPEADHSLEVDDWRASLAIHSRVLATVHHHLLPG